MERGPSLAYLRRRLARRRRRCRRLPLPTRVAVSLIVVLVSLVLVASEVYRFVVPVKREHIAVDSVIEGRLRINFDITFPSLQCAEVRGSVSGNDIVLATSRRCWCLCAPMGV